MRLRSVIAVAVAQAGSCSSNSAPSLGTSYAAGVERKETQKTQETLHLTLKIAWRQMTRHALCFHTRHPYRVPASVLLFFVVCVRMT